MFLSTKREHLSEPNAYTFERASMRECSRKRLKRLAQCTVAALPSRCLWKLSMRETERLKTEHFHTYFRNR